MNFDFRKISHQSFIYKLTIWEQQKFTGYFTVRTLSGVEWKFYLCIGRLIWVTGGNHVTRQLYRHLFQEKLKLDLDKILQEQSRSPNKRNFKYGWDYQVINTLVARKKLDNDRAKQVIRNIVLENLFDVIQYEAREILSYAEFPADLNKSFINFIKIFPIKPLLLEVIENWTQWQSSKLSSIFLDSAPLLKEKEKIKEKMSPKAYQQMVKLTNGKRSLREVANLIKKQEIQVVRSLVPFLQNGTIQLVNIPDFPHPKIKSEAQKDVASHQTIKQIVCIDDSLQVYTTMRDIIQEAGYEFIGVRDPVRALGVLIDRQPDLIFLDLVMPVINGYELCRQIRRVSKLKDIPIVILTSGRIDRWRSKIAGASDCTNKPIDKEKILRKIEQFLPSAHPKNSVVKTEEILPNRSIIA
ncbi:MAG: response regulator [Cyanobacteriota bacterium]|nr:response regulator [Cyanobacteriota bacterium]